MPSFDFIWSLIVPFLSGDDLVKLIRIGNGSLTTRLRCCVTNVDSPLSHNIYLPPINFSKYMASLIMIANPKLTKLRFSNKRRVESNDLEPISWTLIAPFIKELEITSHDQQLLKTMVYSNVFNNLQQLTVGTLNVRTNVIFPASLTSLSVQYAAFMDEVIAKLPPNLRIFHISSDIGMEISVFDPLAELHCLEDLYVSYAYSEPCNNWTFFPKSLTKLNWDVSRTFSPDMEVHSVKLATMLPRLVDLTMSAEFFGFTSVSEDNYKESNCGVPTSLKRLHIKSWKVGVDKYRRLLSVIGSQLEFLRCPITSQDLLPYIQHLKYLNWKVPTSVDPPQPIPPTLTVFNTYLFNHADLIKLPSTLTHCSIESLLIEDGAAKIALNPGIEYLNITLDNFPVGFFNSLPESITQLIINCQAYSALILSHLKKLELLFIIATDASSCIDIDPFTLPTCLTTLSLSNVPADSWIFREKGGMADCLPSLLSLALSSTSLEVLLWLPPRLEHLEYVHCHEGGILTAEICKALPRSLNRISLIGTYPLTVKSDALRSLPPYLRKCSIPDAIDELLPPGLRIDVLV